MIHVHVCITGSDKRVNFVQNANLFILVLKLLPFQGPTLLIWFVSSLDLLLYRSNVRSHSKPPVLRSELPK